MSAKLQFKGAKGVIRSRRPTSFRQEVRGQMLKKRTAERSQNRIPSAIAGLARKYGSHGCATAKPWTASGCTAARQMCATKQTFPCLAFWQNAWGFGSKKRGNRGKTACKTRHFSLRNRPFRILKRVVSQCKTTRFAKQGDYRRAASRKKRPCIFYFAAFSRVKFRRAKC